ncbi:2Fe-2S iron-sulfur cluster-binding protein [Streptomyces sp. NBC_00872]|uniref:2Fe-2S iron-sulfur cluster-binding protein n=1 Tax=Streptomyces sp. NBC_00872 TaxID=2903686 RepID=UPI00386362DD
MTTDENSGNYGNSGNSGRSGNAGNAGPDGGIPRAPGGWQPVPQGGEYDGESTAFVQLPSEDGQDAPLAAPGHGYVPPQITPLTPAEDAGGGVRWPDPRQDGGGQFQASYAQGGYDPGSTGQWNFAGDGTGAGQSGGVPAGSAPSSELTGQWTIPVANGDLPDESGEFSTSMLASQWGGGSPPATLPGGAAAPWATEQAGAPGPEDTGGTGVVGGTVGIGGTGQEGAPGAPPLNEPPAPGVGHDPAGQDGSVHQPAVHDPSAHEPSTHEMTAHDPGSSQDRPEAAAVPASEHLGAPEAEALPEPEPEPEPLTSSSDSAEHPAGSYVLRVNGADRPVTDAWIGESLLYVLRERLGLAGAKDGCSQGECGACNVQVDGRLVASCLVPAATAAGSEVRTVEGLAVDGEPSDVQRALAKCGAVQCGFCIPGMAMTVHDLLEGNHAPSELETRQALCGNLCRCSGYRGVLDAVNEVVAGRTASAEAAAAASEEARIPHQAPPGAGSAQPPHSPDGGMA